jgi:hypothetical protein
MTAWPCVLRQKTYGSGSIHVVEEFLYFMADRKQRARRDRGQGITFKITPLVTYFRQLCLPPKVSRTFQNSATSREINSKMSLWHNGFIFFGFIPSGEIGITSTLFPIMDILIYIPMNSV